MYDHATMKYADYVITRVPTQSLKVWKNFL